MLQLKEFTLILITVYVFRKNHENNAQLAKVHADSNGRIVERVKDIY